MSGAATGVDGLGSTWSVRTLAASELIVLNHPTNWPRFKAIELPGLYSGPDTDDNRAAKTGAKGEELYTSYARGKTIGYEGSVIGQTRDECLVGKSSLLAALGPDESTGVVPELRFVLTPNGSLTDPNDPDPAGIAHTFVGTVQSGFPRIGDAAPRRMAERGEPARWWHLSFSLSVRITNGLFYEWDEATDTPSNPKWA